jgi:NhaA family Na+:H+ antiporter
VEALLGSPVLLGAFFGLVVGKPAGVYLASRLAARLGAALSPGVRWIDIAIVGAVGGIGFTMSLLISELAYANDGALSAAKLGVLSASIAAVAISALLLALRRRVVAAK